MFKDTCILIKNNKILQKREKKILKVFLTNKEIIKFHDFIRRKIPKILYFLLLFSLSKYKKRLYLY